MAPHQPRLGIHLLLLICGVFADDFTENESHAIMERFEKLLAEQIQHNNQLEDTVKSMEASLKELKSEMKAYGVKNRILENQLKDQKLKTERIEPKIKYVQAFCKAEDDVIKQSINKLKSTHGHLPSINRRQLGSSAIAFSSYLDHDLDNLGPSQVIVFNKIQLNDGNGYSQHTGAFTVPASGVYVFTFFIGERNTNQIYVRLVVNGVEKSDAVVETVSASHDAQGGNAVIVKVSKGDAVMILHNTVGSHIEGSPSVRLSTFSGFLLYELDSEVIVGK